MGTLCGQIAPLSDRWGQDMAEGAETTEPDYVVVPAHPAVDGERHDVRFELRQSQTGMPAGVAFTTVAKLVGQLGRYQPWVVLRTDRYRELLARASVSSIMLDPEVDPRTVQWSAEAVDLLAKANNGWI